MDSAHPIAKVESGTSNQPKSSVPAWGRMLYGYHLVATGTWWGRGYRIGAEFVLMENR